MKKKTVTKKRTSKRKHVEIPIDLKSKALRFVTEIAASTDTTPGTVVSIILALEMAKYKKAGLLDG